MFFTHFDELSAVKANIIQLQLELSVEFVRDTAIDGSDLADIYDYETDFIFDSSPKRDKSSFREYSVVAFAHKNNVHDIYAQTSSQLKQKMRNPYNVIGSNNNNIISVCC